MKTSLFKYLGTALLTHIFLSSCTSEFLNRRPLGSVDESVYLNSENGGFKLLINCYTPILDHWNFQQMRFDMGDQLTDDCMKGGSDAADRVVVTEVSRGNPPATSSLLRDLWNHRYQAVSCCNAFLATVTPETKVRYIYPTSGLGHTYRQFVVSGNHFPCYFNRGHRYR